jgi:hypothetical protein
MQFGVDLQPGDMFCPATRGGYGFVCYHAKVTSCRRDSYSRNLAAFSGRPRLVR